MAQKNYQNLTILLCLIFALLIVIGIPLFLIDKLTNEDRDYLLADKMLQLGAKIKQYKQKHGSYSKTLAEAQFSDIICVTFLYAKCRRVYYKSTTNLQDFRMAMHTFSWPILYYHPEISMTTAEFNKLSKAEIDRKTQQFGNICFVCMAYAPGKKPKDYNDVVEYRKTLPLFAQPDEWPAVY